jgi:hypothetical protein
VAYTRPSPPPSPPPPTNPSYSYPPPPPPSIRRPGAYDNPPPAPARKRTRAPEDDWNTSPSTYYDEIEEAPPPNHRYDEPTPPRPNSAAKRQRTNDDHHRTSGTYPRPPPSTSSFSSSSHTASTHPGSPSARARPPPPPPPQSRPPPPDTREVPARKVDPRQAALDETIIKYVKTKIEEDPEWESYLDSQKFQPAVPEILRQFKFVSRQLMNYGVVNTPASLAGAPGRRITEQHVLDALGLPPNYAHEANTILGLWRLYGIRGEYMEDPHIIKLGTAEHVPGGPRLTGNEMHEFVLALAATDRKWIHEHPEDVRRKPGQVATSRPGTAGALPAAAPQHEPVGRLQWKGPSGPKSHKVKERL